jgi:hypothetical protein
MQMDNLNDADLRVLVLASGGQAADALDVLLARERARGVNDRYEMLCFLRQGILNAFILIERQRLCSASYRQIPLYLTCRQQSTTGLDRLLP